jgi:hypothetical protein
VGACSSYLRKPILHWHELPDFSLWCCQTRIFVADPLQSQLTDPAFALFHLFLGGLLVLIVADPSTRLYASQNGLCQHRGSCRPAALHEMLWLLALLGLPQPFGRQVPGAGPGLGSGSGSLMQQRLNSTLLYDIFNMAVDLNILILSSPITWISWLHCLTLTYTAPSRWSQRRPLRSQSWIFGSQQPSPWFSKSIAR